MQDIGNDQRKAEALKKKVYKVVSGASLSEVKSDQNM